ncbi:MAG TPA: hypothetical protein VHE81_05095 [Lacipirellulaceae bacterium]|nr:hypothetical protein [Lacipirellulaceae bacterium]
MRRETAELKRLTAQLNAKCDVLEAAERPQIAAQAQASALQLLRNRTAHPEAYAPKNPIGGYLYARITSVDNTVTDVANVILSHLGDSEYCLAINRYGLFDQWDRVNAFRIWKGDMAFDLPVTQVKKVTILDSDLNADILTTNGGQISGRLDPTNDNREPRYARDLVLFGQAEAGHPFYGFRIRLRKIRTVEFFTTGDLMGSSL